MTACNMDTSPDQDVDDRYGDERWMRRTARRLVGPRLRRWMDSSDLVQDAQVARQDAPPAVRNGPPAVRRRWLEKVMGNLAASYARRRDLQLSGSGRWNEVAESTRTPDAKALAHEGEVDVRRRLRAMDERARKVILMRVVDDKSFAEIAERLGLSEGNARVIFHRALERMRKDPES